MDADITEVICTKDELARWMSELAADISRDDHYKDSLIICILNGGLMFFADLVS
jgi:hypoxanthine-guanine phosphoribosyltransferase